MQELKERRIKIVHGNGQAVTMPAPSKKSFTFRGFFSRSNTENNNKKNTSVRPVGSPVKSMRENVPGADLNSVRTWIALEEKIVHDYKEQKNVSPRKSVPPPVVPAPKPSIVPLVSQPRDKRSPDLSRVKKGFELSGIFAFLRPRSSVKSARIILKDPGAGTPDRQIETDDQGGMPSSAALEERIIHTYHEPVLPVSETVPPVPVTEKKRPQITTSDLETASVEGNVLGDKEPERSRSVVPAAFSRVPVKRLVNTFENFTTRTAGPSSPVAPVLKESVKNPRRQSSPFKFLALWGWFAAGIFVCVAVIGFFAKNEVSQKLVQLQNEKQDLSRSYVALQDVAKQQTAEIKGLNVQLRDVSLEMKRVQADKAISVQAFEKRYRKELGRATTRYESEIIALKNTVETQNAIVSALKAQNHALNNILDQAGISALPGAVSGLYKESAPQGGTLMPEGRIASINLRQNNVVVSIGGSQGASSGRWVTISRNGIGLVNGIIERVYPTMSVVTIRDTDMLKMVKMGDDVSFS